MTTPPPTSTRLPTPTRPTTPRRARLADRPAAIALAFLAPALVALLVLRLLPAGIAFVSSLNHTSLLTGETYFVGLRNYATLFTDPTFLQSVRVTLLFSVIVNPLQIAAALALAVLFTRRFAGVRFLRVLVILPIAVPPAVSAAVWSVAYRPDGLLNSLLTVLGLPPQPFLTSPGQALWSLIVLLSWIGVGYWMMFLIAGLQDIPLSLYEAAAIDGASAWRRFWHVTLPLLRRPLAFVLVADTVANFLVFAPVQMLTNGGPEGSTNVTMYDIFTRAYTVGDLSLAQAEVMLLVLLVLAVVVVQFRLLRGKD
ncbi:carbohydrate ABC transporter membrane protein 1 (CUT1 family) [Nonomuraea fuscirosea]|uniref:Carbohydrate ABC transporter membrane protein 1 (CUT1 family) n=1 Tax=Nonomuraea fuscirosea TaxID=1291556 RepID=A0A2T0NA30_9ACTN|nr:sugar ABC transporter permease [Nonomuraea fuscirosea]PRX69613.1 carbohydrate ABC transporter membrane protein 1 (CUT1 family) [Nonomuraea fuscirosea]